jgi:DNA primase
VPISSFAGNVVKLVKSGREWKACCPFHSDRTPSFTIYADDSRFMCFGCGAEGDVLDFVKRLQSIELMEALQMLENGTGYGGSRLAPASEGSPCDRAQEASALWSNARPVSGTIAEAYLHSRGITVDLPQSLRFAKLPLGARPAMPTLVAAVSTLDGDVRGVQRTFLCSEPVSKARLPGGKAKFSLGRVLGGAIRLGPATRSLIITEGIEDGLTLHQQLGRSVWVAAGAGMLPSMQLPECVRAVVIGADNDAAGQAAAAKAAQAIGESGRQVRIMRPEPGYKDFNDWLVAQGG